VKPAAAELLRPPPSATDAEQYGRPRGRKPPMKRSSLPAAHAYSTASLALHNDLLTLEDKRDKVLSRRDKARDGTGSLREASRARIFEDERRTVTSLPAGTVALPPRT
jgi:hypothetical protein